jgi:hypothetical protein
MGQRAGVYCRVSTADQSCERLPKNWAALMEMYGMGDQIPV